MALCCCGREEQFEPILSGVAGACDRDLRGGVREGSDLVSAGECCGVCPEVVREGFRGGGALEREGSGGGALVFEGDVSVELIFVMGDPFPIGIDPCGIDHEEKRHVTVLVDDEVVEDSAGIVGEECVLSFAGSESAKVICQESVKEAASVVSGHAKFSHVGDIEESAAGANGLMFGDDACILNGH